MAVFSSIAKIISSKQQAKAAKQATNAQVAASADQLALDKAVYQDQRKLTTPDIAAGAQAKARQMLMAGIPAAEVKAYLASTQAAIGADTLSGGAGADTFGAPATPAPGSIRSGFRGQVYGMDGNWGMPDPQTPPIAPSASATDANAWVDAYDPLAFLQATPGFKFQTEQARAQIEKGASARGRLFSPETMNAVGQRTQDVASNYWDKLYSEYDALANGGARAKDSSINIAANFGDNAASRIGDAGNARASGYLRVANAKTMGNQGWAELGNSAAKIIMNNPWGE